MSHEKFSSSKNIATSELGLSVAEFNMLLTHAKIDCFEVLRVLIQSYNLLDFLPWFIKLFRHLFSEIEKLPESSNLMMESLFTLQKLIERYKFSFSDCVISILLVKPNLIHQIMTLFEVILEKSNQTNNQNNEKRKFGLFINKVSQSLKNMYENYDVEYLENTLLKFLQFWHCIASAGILSMCNNKQRL